MGRQKSIMNLEGRVGNFSFYKGRDGYGARDSEGGVTAERVLEDEGYVRTRENGAEFGRAGIACRVMRNALGEYMRMADKKITARLTTEMLKVVKSDPVHDRGERIVTAGDFDQLVGFSLNMANSMKQVFRVDYNVSMDANSGTFSIPAIRPRDVLKPSPGATHYRLLYGVFSVNFEEETYIRTFEAEPAQPISGAENPDVLRHVVLPGPLVTDPTFLVFGIEFIQVVNSKEYPLRSASFNAMDIVAIHAPAPAV